MHNHLIPTQVRPWVPMPSKELCTTHTVEATPCGLSISFFVYKNKRQFKEAKGLKEPYLALTESE